jgi:hypothetical protein
MDGSVLDCLDCLAEVIGLRCAAGVSGWNYPVRLVESKFKISRRP